MYEYFINDTNDTIRFTSFSTKSDTSESYGLSDGFYDNTFKKFTKGKLILEATFKNKLLDGPLTLYFKNGSVKYKIYYKAGCILSSKRVYRKNGKLKQILVPNEARNTFVISENLDLRGRFKTVKKINLRPESILIFGEKYHSNNCVFNSPES